MDVIKQQNYSNNITFGYLEQTVINRILMELYCQNYDSEHFRVCPKKEVVDCILWTLLVFKFKYQMTLINVIFNVLES